MIGRLFLAASLLAASAAAQPQARRAPAPAPADAPRAAPLTLAEVLRASARTAPQIVEALARIRQAEGRSLAAEGAFDTVFDVDARSRLTGYYDGTIVEGRALRPFRTNGGYLYGTYRASRGSFPIYEDEYYTNRLGEAKVGVLFALLRDRAIDERRARVDLAAADIDLARLEGELVSIGVQRRAIDAYQNWVAAGLRLAAYRDLLELAESRRGALERQVTLGARPPILLVENDQNVVRRRALVVRTEGEFAAARVQLSLFFRDERGDPILVGPERLPADPSVLTGPNIGPASAVARPDVQAILARIDQAAVRLALAENELRPRLDLRGELGRDFGDEGLGGFTRSGTEAVAGFRFSVPLQRRQARGRIAEAQAEIEGLRARNRFLTDQIAVEVGGLGVVVEAAERLAGIADQERALADQLAAAERRRFDLGSSDFFLVNQREETATDARVRQVDARARIAAARAELAAATADRGGLGL